MGVISQLWADRIIAGDKSYGQVPAKLKAEVAQNLKDRGYEKLITE